MRWLLMSACALLCLSGCGAGSSEPPKLAINTSKNETPANANKAAGAGEVKKQGTSQTNKGSSPVEVKKQTALPANLGAFDREDVRKTLHWLVAHLAPARAASPGDEAAWQRYDEGVRSAYRQKVSWTLPVDSTAAEGVVTAVVPASEDPLCQGLPLKPAAQPGDGTQTFILEIPAGKRPVFRSGERVTVSGVIERIETYPRRPGATDPYRFHVRLSDYTVVPAK